MICPYRVQVNRTITTSGSIRTVRENVNYAECCEDECPFYRDDVTRREPYCARADIEVGGETF